jgi:glycosyltransferase involved in cell wall biosynthesis
MRVLNLVTNDESQFYRTQLSVLEAQGVDSTTLAVPGDHQYGVTDEDVDGTRSVFDYVKFYPSVLKHSFDSYDLLHANYGLTAPAAIAQPNLPVVLSLWGSDLMGTYGAVSEFCANHCDAVIVMSEDMAAKLDCECYVIPHGIDLDQFHPIPRDQAREEMEWDDDSYHVLFPYPKGRDVKNYPRAERVVEAVRERVDRPVELQIASGIPHELMPYLFNAADVLLVTSRREGSPNTVKEAMACNLPIVSTDVGDVRARLEGVAHSSVATSDERLADAVEDVLLAGERSDGRAAIRSLSTERMGERIRGVYEDVLSEEVSAREPEGETRPGKLVQN